MKRELFLNNEKGASMLEYALLAALIAVVAIAAVTFLGAESSEAFSRVGNAVAGANDAANTGGGT